MTVQDRFLKYVAFDTQSDPGASCYPSTEKQKVLGAWLVEELQALGLEEVEMDQYGYVFATVPGNTPAPVMGLIAHMDTSPDLSGKDVKPRVFRYGGGPVPLDAAGEIVMDPARFEDLERYVGQDLIVTDGSTLLGADDKAGVAEIVTMAEYLLAHPEIPHGKIRIAFTPDEEVGRGTDYFDIKRFGADFAYTVDGGEVGELEYENFNAASADVTLQGSNIHPGSSRGKMVNALLLAMEFQAMLPPYQVPQTTEGYEGFFHLNTMEGDVDHAALHYIVRDHDWDKLQWKLDLLRRAEEYLNAKYGEGTVSVAIAESYRNMKEKLLPAYAYVIDYARLAMERLEIPCVIKPIRGGTDGARLSWDGLPCPNLGTGGHNFHGRYEFISVQAMEQSVELLVELARIVGEKS